MRAWRVERTGPIADGGLRLLDVEEPVAAPDELVVAVEACAVCRTDLHVVLGELPPRKPAVVPGHQVVGRVVARGAALRPGHGAPRGARVGVAWLHRTCGRCRACMSGRENLCPNADFTGWSVDGGFAERLRVPAALRTRSTRADAVATAPRCAGIITGRCARRPLRRPRGRRRLPSARDPRLRRRRPPRCRSRALARTLRDDSRSSATRRSRASSARAGSATRRRRRRRSSTPRSSSLRRVSSCRRRWRCSRRPAA